jgi:hypothetical protein
MDKPYLKKKVINKEAFTLPIFKITDYNPKALGPVKEKEVFFEKKLDLY